MIVTVSTGVVVAMAVSISVVNSSSKMVEVMVLNSITVLVGPIVEVMVDTVVARETVTVRTV